MKMAAVSNVATLQTKDDLARATALREYIEAAQQEARVLNVTWEAPYCKQLLSNGGFDLRFGDFFVGL